MIEINLLPQQNLISLKEKQLRLYLILLTAGLGIFTGLALGGTFTVDALFAARLKSLQQKNDSLQATYQAESPTARQFLTVKEKVAAITSVRADQTTFLEITNSLITLFGQEVKVMELTISGDGKIGTTLSVPSLGGYKAFMGRLTDGKSPFYDVEITGLRQGEDGSFNFSLQMGYKNIK
jgi:hypothetical protein